MSSVAGVPVASTDAIAKGLTSAEAAERLARFGPNEIQAEQRFKVLREGLGLLGNPLVLILIAASAVSGLLGDRIDAAIIIAVVLLSVGLDFFQEFRSDQAASRLKTMVALTATVWRDGAPVEVPVRNVVPGDVLELHAGDLVAADATLLTEEPLSLDEAALTGESLPVARRAGDEMNGSVFAGTSVVSATGRAVVTATGKNTQFGAIANSLVQRAPQTEFERGERNFSIIITRTVIGLVLFVFLVNAVRHQDPLETLLFTLALAVGLTPEFLPMITTVTLSEGAQRMARDKVIVRRLEAIENLGNMDTLCSDKTGTLTRGTVTVQAHVDAWGHDSDNVLRWARVNSGFQTGMQNALDRAIVEGGPADLQRFRKIAELPFDFERRRVSVLVAGGAETQLITKGAPEEIVGISTAVDSPTGPVPLDAQLKATLDATLDWLSRSGYHVLGIARKPVSANTVKLTLHDESDLVLSGFVAFLDPPDPSAAGTLASLATRGVSVKILSGDSEVVTRTICQQVGLRADRIVVGDELARMQDSALWAQVEQVDVFARVSPTQKNRVIQALKHRGHVVGYLGDGINDAPSLHTADVGISVSNGVDVAKTAADVILLEKSLTAIERGVVEGRKSFGNITKYVLMGTSSNFGNVLSLAVASAILPFLPLLPVQILLNNFLYDFSQLTIPTDNVDASYVARPRKWDSRLIQRFMFGLGPISSAYDFLTFGVLLGVFHASPEMFRAGWFIESLATQTLVIFVIRTAGNPFKSRPSLPLVVTVVGGILAGFATVLSPLGAVFGFAQPPVEFFLALLVLIVTYLGIVQVFKRGVYGRSTDSARLEC